MKTTEAKYFEKTRKQNILYQENYTEQSRYTQSKVDMVLTQAKFYEDTLYLLFIEQKQQINGD